MNSRILYLFIILLGFLALVALLDISLGSVKIPFDSIVSLLVGNEIGNQTWHHIFYDFRLPKCITAAFAGAGLSVAGLIMQTLFRNPLAGPFVLGISSGASLGVALVVLGIGSSILGFMNETGYWGGLGIAGAAWIGASSVLGIIVIASYSVTSTVSLLIVGVMVGYFTGAVVSLLVYFSDPTQIKNFMLWTMGNFGAVSWDELWILVIAVSVGIVFAAGISKQLNILLLSDNYAQSMGINVRLIRLIIIMCTSLLAGTVTAFCGPIAFLGLAVPHICRMLFKTSRHDILIPAVVLTGASLALTADVIAQVPGNAIIMPINAITSIIGTPIVLWIILKPRKVQIGF